MLPEHMPYFRGPRVHHKPNEPKPHPHNSTVTNDPPTTNLNAAALLTSIVTSRDVGSTSLSIRPVSFGTFDKQPTASTLHVLYNSDLPTLAHSIARFKWAAYGFNSGHFVSTINKRNLPFDIVLACDPFAYGRSLFHDIAHCTNVFDSASTLLNHI